MFKKSFFKSSKFILSTALFLQPLLIHPLPLLKNKKVILFVWDGLRPDVLTDTKADIPNLRQFAHDGIEFNKNHSAYPTFTMHNAQAFATGDYAGKTGFYGNALYEPWRFEKQQFYGTPINAKGDDISQNFSQIIFTEDYQVLKDLNQHNNSKDLDEPLVQVTTLLQAAQRAGLTTAVVGKSGPAFLQDYEEGGFVLDENHAWPLSFAQELQARHIDVPKNTPFAYPANAFTLEKENTNPTAPTPIVYLSDKTQTTNPAAGIKSPFNNANDYMANIFINILIPEKSPDLSVLWMRNPDTTEHIYGPGSLAYYNALESNDKILGKLMQKLQELKLDDKTNIIIVSDHAHSNVQATKLDKKDGTPQLMYPLHEITSDGFIGAENKSKIKIDKVTQEKNLLTSGFSTSGSVRTAHLITQSHLKTKDGKLILAYDGGGCVFNFGLSGVRKKDGSLDTSSSGYHAADGTCLNEKKEDIPYTSPSLLIPEKTQPTATTETVVIAANGGTDYIYIPSHNPQVAKSLIRFFATREEYSALFLDDSLYSLPQFTGVLPLSKIKLTNSSHRNPDMVISLSYNAHVVVNGLVGTVFASESSTAYRGQHGTFGQIDVHNTLLAHGPDFKIHSVNALPSGNVDVAPTIAHLLNLQLPNTDGRPLLEALNESSTHKKNYKITPFVLKSRKICNLDIFYPTTHPIPSGKLNEFKDNNVHAFQTELHAQTVEFDDGKKVTYFDYAVGKRSLRCNKK